MLGASMMWGMMAPLGHDAMTHGISGLQMICFRVAGASVCFWLASILMNLYNIHKYNLHCYDEVTEKVDKRDYLKLFGAAMFAIIFNQGNYIIGLSITSPLNASIMTTTMPIFTMILAFIFIKEPITFLKFSGVILGACGAATLILSSANGHIGGGVLRGDLQCVAAQFSYAIYLTAFKDIIQKYSPLTCMKWMMTFSSIVFLPFGFPLFAEMDWGSVTSKVWMETLFVVVGGTFISFLLCLTAQKILRPTVVAMYNYVQPIVSCSASVLLGIGVFSWSHLLAIVLIFSGVYMVNRSKAKDDKV